MFPNKGIENLSPVDLYKEILEEVVLWAEEGYHRWKVKEQEGMKSLENGKSVSESK